MACRCRQSRKRAGFSG